MIQTLRQDLRQRLEMSIQPLQILRSELIQLPLLELELRINSELEENPFLDEAEAPEEENPEETEEIPVPKTAEELDEEDGEELPAKTEAKEVDWEAILNDEDFYEYRPRSLPSSVEVHEIPRAATLSMNDHIRTQLRTDRLIGNFVEVGEYILGSLTPDGYLDMSVEEISADIRIRPEIIEAVIKRIQTYDPPGIAARSLQECLIIQLEAQDNPDPNALRMLKECFKEFTNKKYEIIAKKLEVTLEEVKKAYEIVTKLNPKPGEGLFDEKQNYIVPDLIVKQIGDDFEIFINDGSIPNFYVNTEYRNMVLAKKKVDKKTREFVHRKLESARWFINAIHQRRSTMLRTMRAIVKKQEDFFRFGKEHLRPMILQDIADDIEMDIATISRVTNGKYVQTDFGVIELKYFFSQRMETNEGEDVSTRIIKSKLREIVDKENKASPWSDEKLAELLSQEGYTIARRTVQKYREQLSIPVKRLRREIV
ncbi:RNA polymerase sigma-54 factor [candidate division LCP-89 bacterium B3_LCP]|uniref:RNA polymerase sigma-54 factor n=1 Tax=candidate division LCP-89 bacterium B3_LCP TaxID=2012998 RepID=A0A532V3U7_UNCL8|nr:MAG: RNA polymerase sigma-54 factor [candidate division LCP-89 bacterium B3_LCP]